MVARVCRIRQSVAHDVERDRNDGHDGCREDQQVRVIQEEAAHLAQEQAQRRGVDAQAQAQAIIDEAVNEANGIRQASINYTDDMLNSLQTIITHSMEGAQSRFDAFISSMQSSYDIVSSNRGELAGSVTSVEETPEEAPAEEQ